MREDRWFIALRLSVALALSMTCLAAPAWAEFQVGMDAYNRGDFKTALREWQPMAEQGDARAQFYFGLLYENGDGVPLDYAKARQWYEKAAAQGDGDSPQPAARDALDDEADPADALPDVEHGVVVNAD